MKPLHNQHGGIIAFLFGAIGILALISLGAFQFMSGAATGADDGVKTINARNAMNMNLQGMAARAYRLISDCDTDGTFETTPFVGHINAPVNGGILPMNSGATLVDPWGTRYGYCAWDQGSKIGDAACGGGTGYLSGSPTPTADQVQSQTVMAIISAGANRTFETTCNNYTNGTTDVIASGGDDIVHRYSYRQAAHATSNRWGGSVAASSCGDLTASMSLDRSLFPFAQESSLQPTNVSATFEMTIELPTTLSDSIILESGATGRGIGIWLEGNDVVFAAGDGTVSATDGDNVKIRADVSSLAGQEIVLTAAVDPLNGQLALYINGCHTVSGETTDGTNLSSDNWAGTNDVGYGTKATGIRTDMPTVNFAGTLKSKMNFYSGELPDGFPNAPSGGGGTSVTTSLEEIDTSVWLFARPESLHAVLGGGAKGTLSGQLLNDYPIDIIGYDPSTYDFTIVFEGTVAEITAATSSYTQTRITGSGIDSTVDITGFDPAYEYGGQDYTGVGFNPAQMSALSLGTNYAIEWVQ